MLRNIILLNAADELRVMHSLQVMWWPTRWRCGRSGMFLHATLSSSSSSVEVAAVEGRHLLGEQDKDEGVKGWVDIDVLIRIHPQHIQGDNARGCVPR
jgi:hypothetical protein